MTDLPRYRAVERCCLQPIGYAAPALLEIGSEVEYLGKPGMALLPLNEAAKAAKAASIDLRLVDVGSQIIWQRLRLGRSVGYAGKNSAEAREFIAQFINEYSS